LALYLALQKDSSIPRRPLATLAAGAVLAALLALRPADPLWQFLRLNRLLSYPWQMLGFAGLALALLARAAARQTRALAAPPVLAGLLVLCAVSVYSYLAPAWSEVRPARSRLLSLATARRRW
jgi:carbon starvation protein CstA